MQSYETRSVHVPTDFASLERSIRSREKHLDVLVVIWVLVGVFYVLYGLAVAALMVLMAGTDEGLDPQLRIVLPILAIGALLACLVMAGWIMITAWALHRRRRSGRISSYVLSVLMLMTVCFAPVGIYAFWVLVGRITDMAFGQFPEIARAPAPASAHDGRAGPARERNLTPLPPDPRPRRAGLESYPRPPVAATTPPMGVPKHMPAPAESHPSRSHEPRRDIDSLPTVQDMPAPVIGRSRNRSS